MESVVGKRCTAWSVLWLSRSNLRPGQQSSDGLRRPPTRPTTSTERCMGPHERERLGEHTSHMDTAVAFRIAARSKVRQHSFLRRANQPFSDLWWFKCGCWWSPHKL